METIELQLDTQTLGRARKLAASRQCTLEELLKALIEHLEVAEPGDDRCLGMFADEPMLMDQVVTSAMQAREVHPLRQDSE
jgi:hypothetical protein